MWLPNRGRIKALRSLKILSAGWKPFFFLFNFFFFYSSFLNPFLVHPSLRLHLLPYRFKWPVPLWKIFVGRIPPLLHSEQGGRVCVCLMSKDSKQRREQNDDTLEKIVNNNLQGHLRTFKVIRSINITIKNIG